jgi:hypothetical protein
VRAAFKEGLGEFVESRRPFVISVVAVLSLIGGLSCLLMAFLPFPGAFLGLTLRGWEKAVFYLASGALFTSAGIGLWRLQEWGRRLALAMQVVGLIQCVVFTVRPSLMTKYSAEINGAMGVAQPQMSPQFQNTMYVFTFGFSALLAIGIIAILHYYRGAFRPTAAPPQLGQTVAAS